MKVEIRHNGQAYVVDERNMALVPVAKTIDHGIYHRLVATNDTEDIWLGICPQEEPILDEHRQFETVGRGYSWRRLSKAACIHLATTINSHFGDKS